MRAKTKNVLVLGKRNSKVRKLERIMAEYFYSICLVSELTDMVQLVANDHFNVIIVTDSLGYKMNKDFFYELRVLFPQARVLCLVDHITQEMEMAMRSARLVFLGSYEHFCEQYQDILQSAVKTNLAYF